MKKLKYYGAFATRMAFIPVMLVSIFCGKVEAVLDSFIWWLHDVLPHPDTYK